MPLPIIPNVYRCALVSIATTYVPRTVYNVLHVSQPTGDETDLGTSLDATLSNAMFTLMSSNYVTQRVEITKLDGTSASVSFPFTSPPNGGAAGVPVPEAACSVGLKTVARGRSKRGRVFVGPVPEGYIDDGTLDVASVAAMQTAWTSFLTALSGRPVPANLVVASYLTATALTVSTINVKPYVATQRRRLVRTRS
jgi:hypothetical protein